ncbi:MAG: Methyltransferase type 11 [Candidatus Yanofskybacteria bacterium GW2011_GWA1_48_10]|uniref:Methyltransferase type 11 n=1 Tax=Candidatus Yanofskybacteria bacterium GW2011_GWA1_48_10 TaxID=1619022 RepID=A0A0G1X5Z3_9BACT|nr:MAG: Methyltransferase type 11 [Microgenomates group bacterium GW2011_GWA2_44_7]KKU89830.1 MAG: Methyltransferase type 11 [Candidatus Yanofskybacteria bacterium GW2011_GWA1_48_10]
MPADTALSPDYLAFSLWSYEGLIKHFCQQRSFLNTYCLLFSRAIILFLSVDCSSMKFDLQKRLWHKFWAYFWYPKIYVRAKILAPYLAKFLQKKSTILDIGGGQGILSLVLARLLQAEVVNTDIVDYSTKGVPFVLSKKDKLPFNDKSFDYSLLIDVLHHCPAPEALLKEAKRVTRSQIVILENNISARAVGNKKDLHWLMDAVQSVIFGIPLPRSIPVKYWQSLLKREGFVVTKEEDTSGKLPLINQHLFVIKTDLH